MKTGLTRAILAAMLLVLSPAATAAAPTSPAVLPASAAVLPAAPAAWGWPLSPRPAVLRTFDPPAKPWLSGHRGVDLRAVHDGAPVASPASGTVSFVGVVVDRPVITVDHGNGLRSSFEPVESGLPAGAAVAAGDTLGRVRPGHCGPDPCVHWGVRRGAEYLNPLAFVMDLRPSVLLPVLPGAAGPAGAAAAAELRVPPDLPVLPDLKSSRTRAAKRPQAAAREGPPGQEMIMAGRPLLAYCRVARLGCR